ncbi:hypothetical protein HUX88_11145 [Duganella sp. BJB1802]|uniref:hypothetical protein n=1 Tax=Duganella sp. BJB1802 TaxID=2744575 RepID=UPI001592C211|nr:hypothetical protein [Duganella sp. BJB1802]NVD71111.1 hypothetical protein [Duganella sp. BJB1802]
MRAAYLLVAVMAGAGLSACGGGGGGAAGGVTQTAAQPATAVPAALAAVAPGTAHTMAANETVLVPAGAVVSGPDGSTITINGQSNTINVSAGAVVTVPATATGAATNQVAARAASQATILVSEPIAGGGMIGGEAPVDGDGSQARFSGIYQLVADRTGNLFASDRNGIRQIAPTGAVTTLRSTPAAAFDGLALDAAGNFYGAGVYDDTIYRRPPDGVVKPWFTGWNGGVRPQASVRLAADGAGNVYLADYFGKRILKFSAAGVRSVLAGGGAGDGNDGVGAQAAFHGPTALAFDATGALLVNDSDAVRRVLPDGTVKTVARIPKRIIPPDSPIAVDAAGNAYVAGDSDLRLVKPDGSVTVLQMMGGLPYTTALAIGGDGRLYAGTGWSAPVRLWKISQ